MKFSILKADVLSRHANFPISLPSHATCSTPRTFLPSILPSSSSIFKQVADTYSYTYWETFLSFCSIQYSQGPVWIISSSSALCGAINPSILYSQLLQAGSTLIVLRSSMCWIRQQLDKWSVVEPTWLPSSNREASLRGYERLTDQRQESGWK